MGGHKTIRSSDIENKPQVFYQATQEIPKTPNAEGNYIFAGLSTGGSYYARTTGTYFLWYDFTNSLWLITDEVDVKQNIYWQGGIDVIGHYVTLNGPAGHVDIALGVFPT